MKKIVFYGDSDVGRSRLNNEDEFVAERLDENTLLAIVIDGVGGNEGGEVAAAIAKTGIPKYLREYPRGECLELLKRAVVSANNAIFNQRLSDKERSNMSCVLTSAIIDTERKVIDMVHVGDTRLYQYYRGGLRKLSHDHSYVGYSEEIGRLTEEQAMHHHRRNEVNRTVGDEHHEVYDPDFLEAEEFPLLPNSILLLCSDGLTDMITQSHIISIIEQNITLEEKVRTLIDAANEAGGRDNITVVLVEYQDEEEIETESPIADENDEEKREEFLPENDEAGKKENGKKRMYMNMLLGCIAILAAASVCLSIFSIVKCHHIRDLENRVREVEVQLEQINNLPPYLFNPMDTLNDSLQNPIKLLDNIQTSDHTEVQQVE